MYTREKRDAVVIRFAGDSGDGIQLTGMEFTTASGMARNETVTLPSFPAEIRAPAGTIAGVSSYQIQFGRVGVSTPGDIADVLVAFNPAALKASLSDVRQGGIIVLNEDAFTQANLEKVGYETNPCTDKKLRESYHIYPIRMSTICRETLKETGLKVSEMERCKNYFALGVMLWLFDRPSDPVRHEIQARFKKKPIFASANVAALNAGIAYGETAELFDTRFVVAPADLEPGTYRNINGTLATVFGLLAASVKSGLPLYYAAYPITPATDLLHDLVRFQSGSVMTFQAEDEIAAMCSAIGAAFAGALAVTGTSGPGMSLKSEALGLAVITELPVVVINVQRAGPATGIPTKSEQTDLLQAQFGRHGEAPLCVLAASSPDTAFKMAYEASRIAVKYMTPVILMTEGYITNTFGPWRIPDTSALPPIEVCLSKPEEEDTYHPYRRTGNLARQWAIPGTPGLCHRVGGLERDLKTGSVSSDGANHEEMCRLRREKIEGIANDIPLLEVDGPPKGRLLVLGWGGTEGAIRDAVRRCREKGWEVARAHLYYMNPFPRNVRNVLTSYDHVLVPESNSGQLLLLVRAAFAVHALGLNRLNAEPLKVGEIEAAIERFFTKGD